MEPSFKHLRDLRDAGRLDEALTGYDRLLRSERVGVNKRAALNAIRTLVAPGADGQRVATRRLPTDPVIASEGPWLRATVNSTYACPTCLRPRSRSFGYACQ